jgi:hypothetical protein
VTPYLEVRSLPPGHRRWLAAICGVLLVLPVGTLLPGSSAEPLTRALAILAIMVLSPVLGLGLARPRALLTVDADLGTIALRTSGALPDPRARETTWPIGQAERAQLEELGTPAFPSWGVRIDLAGDAPLHLRAYADIDLARDTLDHLVLLGIPGQSRAKDRERELVAEPPGVWL